MAILSVQTIDPVNGTVVTYAAAAGGGDSFPNSGNMYFRVKNGGGASITVTLDCPATDNFGVSGSVLDLAFTVAAGAERVIGPLSPARFNDTNGRVQVAYSAVTSVTVAVTQGAA